ncbi:MAG: hypothetical protein NT068_01975 [Candidatus Nomurabacteria bacterium]|nr:hypothetical protein [Candidatus Nomurabacteria bacterium]
MLFLFLALVTALIGASPFLVSKDFGSFIVAAIIYLIVGWLAYYFFPPCLEYGLFDGVFGVTFVFSIISTVITMSMDSDNSFSLTIPIVGLIVLIFACLSSCGSCNTTRYAALVGNISKEGKTLKHWTQQNQEISPSHIRIVPKEHALSIAKTSLNQNSDGSGNLVGSQFTLSEKLITLQKVDSEMYYVIPLDFKNWGVWNNVTTGVPGFVIVDAEDQHATPRYIDGHSMKFTPGACFSQNLERYLYSEKGYSNKILTDYSFELNDSLKPYWVISVCHHTIGTDGGIVVDGVVIVDPENGETNYYDKNKAPSWVDRIIPEQIINNNLKYWGTYSSGFWNNTSWGTQANLREPESTLLNYGSDGTCWYVTPMTSTSGEDHTMTDLIYTNSRTGESHRYCVSGSTEEKITATVDATVKFQNLHAAAIVFENVSDKLTALVPILAEDHSIRGLALVDVATKSLAWDPDPANALMKYQNSLGSIASAIGTDIATNQEDYVGVIGRINEGFTTSGSLYYLYFNKSSHIYVVPQSYREVLISQPGDSVRIKFLDSPSDLISVNYFDNLSLNIKASKNQSDVINRTNKKRADERLDASRKSVKGTINNGDISNEVLDSIARDLGKQKNSEKPKKSKK